MAKYGEIQLGDRVRAKVDKFEGIAVGITEYLHQCRQVLVRPEKLDDKGGRILGDWVDEPWLDVTEKGVHKPQGAVNEQIAAGQQRPRSGAETTHPAPSVPGSRHPGGA